MLPCFVSVLELVLGQGEEWKNKRGEEWRNNRKTDEKEWINMFLAQMNYNCVQMEQNYYAFFYIQNKKHLIQMLSPLMCLLKANNILNKEK